MVQGPRTRPAIRWPQLLLGVALVTLGAALVWRPLTGLLVLLALAAIAATLLAATRAPSRRLATAYLVAGTAALGLGTWGVRTLVAALPVVLAIGLAAAAGTVVGRAARREEGRLLGCLGALALALTAALVGMWPDAALIALSVLGWAAVIVQGIILIVGSLSRPRDRRDRPVVRWARTVAAVTVLALLVVASTAVRAQNPIASGFYDWAAPIPAPGTLLKVQAYSGHTPYGATALTILYSTTREDGSPAVASAVVAIPATPAPAGGRTVLAWQHGTTGVSRPCAPSLTPEALTDVAIPGIEQAIARGWVAVATDYPGMGTGDRYPYLIGRGEGQAALDAVRATRGLDRAEASERVWLWGHSQGGHATLWAGALAPAYAPELSVIGVAALSSASSPLTMAEGIASRPALTVASALISAWVLVPYSDEYPDVRLADLVHPAGGVLIDQMSQRCALGKDVVVSALLTASTLADSALITIDLSPGPTRSRLEHNEATGIVGAPLFLGQGEADEVVPIAIQRTLSATLCSASRVVTTHEYPGATHMSVIAPGSPLIADLFTWVDQVESGKEPVLCA